MVLMKKTAFLALVVIIVAFGGWYWVHSHQKSSGGGTKTTAQTKEEFNKKRYSLTDPTSLWVIANKHNPLQPKNYAPGDLVTPDIPLRLTAKDDEMLLRKPAADALKDLADGAKADGLELMVASGYRSYNFQVGLYNTYVRQQGQAVADSQSARPGFSEHQTGLAVDVEPGSRKCEVETCFGELAEGKWVAANAWKYGFVIRYQENKQSTTGYIYEPWHLRYVGKDLSTELHNNGNPTLEDFFGLGAAPDYQ
jgi:zinc D-Ala-D-Ala carboxypeptidase